MSFNSKGVIELHCLPGRSIYQYNNYTAEVHDMFYGSGGTATTVVYNSHPHNMHAYIVRGKWNPFPAHIYYNILLYKDPLSSTCSGKVEPISSTFTVRTHSPVHVVPVHLLHVRTHSSVYM